MGKEYVLKGDALNKSLESIFNNGVLLIIEGGGWGNRKKIAEDKLQQHGLAPDAVSAVQNLISRDEVASLRAPINKAHGWARDVRNSLPWISNSFHVIHKDKKDVAKAKMEELIEELRANKTEFLRIKENGKSKYQECKDEFREKHPDLYDEANYPTPAYLDKIFRLRYYLREIAPVNGNGSGVSVLTSEERALEARKYKEQIKEVVEESVAATRACFLDMLQHLTTILTEDKRVVESAVEKPKQFLKELGSINLFGDVPLLEISDKIRNILDGVYAEDLRDDAEYKKAIGYCLKTATEHVKSLPIVKLERDIELDF